jgi:hypothetical protein
MEDGVTGGYQSPNTEGEALNSLRRRRIWRPNQRQLVIKLRSPEAAFPSIPTAGTLLTGHLKVWKV